MSDVSTEEQLLEFLYACPVGLIDFDASGQISMLNPHAMQHLLPLAGQRDVSNLFSALEQHAPELRSMVAAFDRVRGRICDDHRIFVDLGSGPRTRTPRVLSCTLVKLGPARLMATLSDISEQVARDQRLRQADAWFASVLDDINHYAALTITPAGVIKSANREFTRQTGHDCAAVIGCNLADLLGDEPEGGGLRLSEQLCIADRDGWHLQEFWQHRTSGERYWCQRLVVARSESGDLASSEFSIVLRDVPKRDGAAEDIWRLLRSDPLTHAANRRYFRQLLERDRKNWRDLRQPVALVVLDLDRFKSVNDTFGHPVGDILLCRVAEVCSSLLVSGGTFARLGGEEFAALLPRHDEEQALCLAEAMRQAIAGLEIATPSGPLRTTASFGCATLDETDGSTDGLLTLADERLYAAKREGRNRVYRVRPQAA